MRRKNSIFGVIVLMVGCRGQIDPIPEATPGMAQKMGMEQAQLARGRETYMESCNRCHDRVLPGKLDAEYWRGIIPHMAQNADLSKSQETDVLVYLMAAHGAVHGKNLEP